MKSNKEAFSCVVWGIVAVGIAASVILWGGWGEYFVNLGYWWIPNLPGFVSFFLMIVWIIWVLFKSE